jgi:hypothetical protein
MFTEENEESLEGADAVYQNTSKNHFISMVELKQFLADTGTDRSFLDAEFKVFYPTTMK